MYEVIDLFVYDQVIILVDGRIIVKEDQYVGNIEEIVEGYW